jgi:hypothetical protein
MRGRSNEPDIRASAAFSGSSHEAHVYHGVINSGVEHIHAYHVYHGGIHQVFGQMNVYHGGAHTDIV